MMGESPGYDLQVAFISLGLEELGLASADIQLGIPCAYSYVRVLDALEGTWGRSATWTRPGMSPGAGRRLRDLLLESGG